MDKTNEEKYRDELVKNNVSFDLWPCYICGKVEGHKVNIRNTAQHLEHPYYDE